MKIVQLALGAFLCAAAFPIGGNAQETCEECAQDLGAWYCEDTGSYYDGYEFCHVSGNVQAYDDCWQEDPCEPIDPIDEEDLDEEVLLLASERQVRLKDLRLRVVRVGAGAFLLKNCQDHVVAELLSDQVLEQRKSTMQAIAL